MDAYADPTPGSTAARRSVGRHDLAVAAGLCACLLLVYGVLAQDMLYGDAEMMLRVFDPLGGPSRLWVLSLLVVVARALRAIGVGATPFESLRAVSTFAGAVGAAAVFLLARGMGAGRRSSLAASLLLACAPAWVFFATTIEIHVLHAACFALAACAVVFAPWQRPLLALLLTSLALPLVCLSHQTGPILGAGLLALVQVGRQRRGLAPLSLRSLCFGVGPVYLAVLLASFAWNTHLSGAPLSDMLGRNVELVEFCSVPVTLSTFNDLWLAPLGVLLPVAIASVLTGALVGWRAAMLVATVVPSFVFFTTWGVTERGGYALPSAVALTASGALLFSRFAAGGRLQVVTWLMVGLHAVLALVDLQLYQGPRLDDFTRGRSAVVRETLGSPCVLYSVNFRSLFIEFPGAREVNLYPRLLEAQRAQATPEEFARDVFADIEADLEAGITVGLDLSSHEQLRIFSPLFLSYMEALQERLGQELWVTRVDDTLWPLERLRPRPPRGSELTHR
ncbi:MAG TPA: hypothetical protein VMT18_02935 [Planctomycetota bacterium]|nr:hypothetical protein [Planctomycetota bacterium]